MIDFWDIHGLWFIFFMMIFPRLTILFTGIVTGGFWWWFGWLLAPRLLVAILATSSYWDTNPILVILSWFWALGGESAEKNTFRNIPVR